MKAGSKTVEIMYGITSCLEYNEGDCDKYPRVYGFPREFYGLQALYEYFIASALALANWDEDVNSPVTLETVPVQVINSAVLYDLPGG
jgi:hypothetical protein